MFLSFNNGTAEEFVLNEFKNIDFKDQRLVKRFHSIMTTMQKKTGSCIRKIFTEKKEAKQAYDFFSNVKIISSKMKNEHYARTAERIQASTAKYVLLIQDRTILNFTNHLAKTDIGRIGKSGNTEQYGLYQHNTLCVTNENECLGLIDLTFFHNDEYDKGVSHEYKKIEEKSSSIWLQSAQRSQELIGNKHKTRIIHVADRESDIFEFLHHLKNNDQDFVIRASHDRLTTDFHQKIRELLAKESNRGEMSVEFQHEKSREKEEMTLFLKAKNMTLSIPKKRREARNESLTPLNINVVQAYNDEQEWILLTTLSIESSQDIQEIITIYKQRWHIESFHKVLKTAYEVDKIYLHKDRQTIENFLTMASISACRLYWFIFTGRVEGDLSADQFFEGYEIKSLYIYLNEKIPDNTPNLRDFLLKIAQIGGYKKQGIKQAPPGIKVMWRGFSDFSIACRMYKNLSTKS